MKPSKSLEVLTPLYNLIDRLWHSSRLPTILWIIWGITRTWSVVALSTTPVLRVLTIDAKHYDTFARHFAEHGWGKELWFMNPGYPTLVGVIYWIFTAHPIWVVILQTVLEAIALGLTLAIGRRLLSETAVRIALFTWVCYSPFVYFNATVLTTITIVVLNAGAFYSLITADEGRRWLRLSVAGLLMGASILCRPLPWLLLPFLVLYWLMDRKERKRIAGNVLWLGLGLAFAILPVAIRNYRVSGNFVVTQTSGGTVFWIGNHEGASGSYDEPSFLTSAEPEQEAADYQREASNRAGRSLNPAEVSSFWTKEALNWITSHPGDYLNLLWHKLLWFGNRTEIPTNISYYVVSEHSTPVRSLPMGWGWILTFAGAGIYAIWQERKKWWLLGVVSAGYLAGNLLFYTASEYRFPLVPWLILLLAAAIAFFAQKLRHGDADRVMIGIMFLVPGFLWSHYDNKYLVELRSPRNDYFSWAQVSLREGRQFEAMEFYHRTLAIDPFYYEGHYQLASLYQEMGFSDLARQEFSRIGIKGPELLTNDELGISDSTGKISPQVREAFYRKLLRETGGVDRTKLLLSLGTALQEQSKWTEARSLLEEAAKRDTTTSEVMLRLAQIDVQEKKYSDALRRVDQVLDLEVDNVLANILRYHVLKNLGRMKEAEDQISQLGILAERDANWEELLRRRLHSPLGFDPTPELLKIVGTDSNATQGGNW